jgi:four helix bundle suffix protein
MKIGWINYDGRGSWDFGLHCELEIQRFRRPVSVTATVIATYRSYETYSTYSATHRSYQTYSTYSEDGRLHDLFLKSISKDITMPDSHFIPDHGGYEKLLSFQKARIVFDGTFQFCERFLKRGDRTIDQMVQAARSGKQNILEGSQASGTSKEMEIKLVGVARASLEELLEDYRDYLRTRGHQQWAKDSREALFVRQIGSMKHTTYESYKTYIETRSAEVVANIMICLIHQTNYLLDQQLRALEKAFVNEGGLRERMTRARLDSRNGRGRLN